MNTMPFKICDFSAYKKELLIKNYVFSERFTRAKLEREKVIIENESENAVMFFKNILLGEIQAKLFLLLMEKSFICTLIILVTKN